MAKITITIEDRAEGGVHSETDPPMDDIMVRAKLSEGMDVTPAEAYAMVACRAIIAANRRTRDGDSLIVIPRGIYTS